MNCQFKLDISDVNSGIPHGCKRAYTRLEMFSGICLIIFGRWFYCGHKGVCHWGFEMARICLLIILNFLIFVNLLIFFSEGRYI